MGGTRVPGQLTFVINATESDPRGIKSVVNTHIAKITHQRRRDARANRSELPVRAINRGVKLEIRKRCACGQRRNDFERCSCMSREAIRATRARLASCSPAVLVNWGNSDPFVATPIVVDATINDLLAFCRDFLLPCLHGREVDSGQLSYAGKFWQDTTDALQDECSGYAYLARYAAIIASITHQSSISVQAIQFRDLASVTLRTRLSTRGGFKMTEKTCWEISPPQLAWLPMSWHAFTKHFMEE